MRGNSTKIANEFKNLLDDAMRSLASKSDIDPLKILIKELSDVIKELGLKCRESLRLNGFQREEKKSSENCAKMVKQYSRNTLKVEVDDNDFNRIHRIGQKSRGGYGKEYQQVIVKFKKFHPKNESI